MARWAVFDVDGTLFPPSSMEKSFLILMMKKGIIPFINIFYYLTIGAIRSWQTGYEEGYKNNKLYLRDLPVIPVRKAAGAFVKTWVRPRLSPTGLQKMAECRKRGYKILIMSGSPDFLTCALSEYLQPDFTISAETEYQHNRFTGYLKNLHPYGERKTRLLSQNQEVLQIDYSQSIVFANHDADIHHMQLFHTAVAVNPTPGLQDFARRAGWHQEKW